MSSDMDSRGIIFELQWRKKQGIVHREEDIASLGIWDTDPALDWVTFKSYLSQNLGTSEDISVAYVDSEGDELPIESECEFHEALKFARQQTRKGRKIVLKVDKNLASSMPVPDSDERRIWKNSKRVKGLSSTDKAGTKDDKRHNKPTYINTSELFELVQRNDKMMNEKLENIAKIQDQQRKSKLERDDYLSPMLKKYLQKMKNEIVAEVTTNMRVMLTNLVISPPSHPIERRIEVDTITGTKSKKRVSDEDSSDAALGSDQRDHKLLRKIEKLHKREKKLEKKLDSKLEKLESKTKRMMEKKSQCKLRADMERIPEKKLTRKRAGDGSVGTYLMDAILLDGPKAETHIKLGKRFAKIWEIMNNGTLPWTDKTELRLAWGTLGLEPEEAVVKCPILEPGEKGQIAVNFRAPDFPGTFESYWHFYHMGERFGHWVGCAVVVEEPVKFVKSPAGAAAQLPKPTEKYNQGAMKKSYFNSEKEGHGNFEKLDNLEAKDEDASANRKVLDDPSSNQNLDNIEKENNIQKIDVAVDLSMKNNPENQRYTHVDPNHPNNNNINVAQPDRQVFYVPSTQDCDPTLEGSDYDNLSMFSGLSDDSDEEEKFVIVPMPACFMRDVPLSSGNVPVLVKDHTSKNLVNSQSSGSIGTPAELLSKSQESIPAEIERDEEFLSLPSTDSAEQSWAAEDLKPVTYAVDAEGSCIPLASAWPSNPATKIPLGYAAKPCPSPKRKQPDTKSSQSSSTSSSSFKTNHFSQASQTFSYGTNTNAYTHTYDGFLDTGSTSAKPRPHPSRPTVSQTTTYSYSGTFPLPQAPGAKAEGPSRAESTSQTGTSDGAVHILPETIVNGAINVATSALNTARTVLNNFRSTPSPAKSSGAEEQTLPGVTTDEALKMLADMGFYNRVLNAQLLNRYNNDVAKVVSELVRGNVAGVFNSGP